MNRDSKDEKKIVNTTYHNDTIVEFDPNTGAPVDNNFGYTMGTMSILFDSKIGLVRLIPEDIVNEILEYLFWKCLICTGPVVITNTICSQLCVLGRDLLEDSEDEDGAV